MFWQSAILYTDSRQHVRSRQHLRSRQIYVQQAFEMKYAARETERRVTMMNVPL